jgi:hypothetical protein
LIEMAKHAHHKREAAIIVPTAARSWLSATERTAAGKVLRDKVPRVDHGAWRAPSGRSDPIRILHKADAGRLPELVLLRYGRMLVSPFTFYRGSADIIAADLSGTPATGIRVQCCGDAQLMNFGGFATPERHLVLDVNDLDETLPAPWEWDVKRPVASFVLAARCNGLSDAAGHDAAVAAARSYREHMRDFAAMDVLDIWYSRVETACYSRVTRLLEPRPRMGDR